MFYGIEQSTDLRSPGTLVKKFLTESALRSWLAHSGRFTHSDPEVARNHHHTFRYGYRIKGAVNKKDPIFQDIGSRDYPRNTTDNLASYIQKYGDEIE